MDAKVKEYLLDILDLLQDALYVDPEDVEHRDRLLRLIYDLEARIRSEP